MDKKALLLLVLLFIIMLITKAQLKSKFFFAKLDSIKNSQQIYKGKKTKKKTKKVLTIGLNMNYHRKASGFLMVPR